MKSHQSNFRITLIATGMIGSILIGCIFLSSCGLANIPFLSGSTKQACKEVERLGGTVSLHNKHSVKRNHLSSWTAIGSVWAINLEYANLQDAKMKTIFPQKNMITLYFAGSNITDKQIEHIGQCQNLIRLNLEWTNISDEGLRKLPLLPSLIYINLSTCNITDEGLQSLSQFPSLERVFLYQTPITEKGVKELSKKNPNLRIHWTPAPSEEIRKAVARLGQQGAIILGGGMSKYNPYRPEAPRRMASYHVSFTPYNHFGIRGWKHDDGVVRWLKTLSDYKLSDRPGAIVEMRNPDQEIKKTFLKFPQLKSLQSLHLSGFMGESKGDYKEPVPWVDEDLKLLSKMSIREFSILDSSLITANGIKHLSKIKGLKTLTIGDMPSTPAYLEAIAKCQTLETLELSRLDLKNHDFEVLQKIKTLKKLEINSCENVEVDHLFKIKGLKNFSIDGLPSTPSCLDAIAQCSALETLRLGNFDLAKHDLGVLRKIKTLKNLEVHSCENAGMKQLAKIKGLRNLIIRYIPSTPSYLDGIDQCPTLETLELSSLNLKNYDFEVLQKIKTLKKLEVRFCKNVDKVSLKRLQKARPKLKISVVPALDAE